MSAIGLFVGLFWLVLAVAMAAFAGNVAHGKGRSGFGWFLFGLVLWPVALLAILLLGPRPEVLERRALRRGTAKKCPRCAEIVRAEASVCRHCGHDFRPAPPPPRPEAVAPASSGPQWRSCPSCKGRVGLYEPNCMACGRSFEKAR